MTLRCSGIKSGRNARASLHNTDYNLVQNIKALEGPHDPQVFLVDIHLTLALRAADAVPARRAHWHGCGRERIAAGGRERLLAAGVLKPNQWRRVIQVCRAGCSRSGTARHRRAAC